MSIACPKCGKDTPEGSPNNICPACLLKLGLAGAFLESDLKFSTGDRIGRYRLLELIGEGGFGAVWKAEQAEPVRRQVALKLLKFGMDTHEFIIRFEIEAQALAMMDHPNIAKILDAGATDHGRPFFVMELVQGVPITKFCDDRGLNVSERVELFSGVCEAVQHAHSKGVIHRDIKPQNILVYEQDGRIIPKIIDFGVAKAIESPITDESLLTRLNQALGTPTYMSPEQAGLGGLDIDIRSDVYSLGVLLFELLTGKPPFTSKDLGKAGREAMLKVIRDTPPPKPSACLRSFTDREFEEIARQRNATSEQLQKLVSGDLDWIILKAIEKDRDFRYPTANAFAADLRRYLLNEPISAGPPTFAYRGRKFVRKHWVPITAGFGAFLLLLVGIIGTSWQAFRATQFAKSEAIQRQRAETGELNAQRSLYAAESYLAHQSLADGNLGRATQLLMKHFPTNSELRIDSARWEWRYLFRKVRSDEALQLNHDHFVTGVDFSADGKAAITVSADRVARIWDWNERKVLASFTNVHALRTVAHAHSRTWAAIAGHVSNIVIWDWSKNKALHTLTNTGTTHSLRISPDDQWLASAGFTSIALWDLSEGTLLKRIPTRHVFWLPAGIAFSPDSKHLAYHLDTEGEAVLDLETGISTDLPKPNLRDVISMAYSPDGRFLVSGANSGVVHVRDAKSGSRLAIWTNHVGFVSAIAISPNGKVLATAGADQKIRLHQTATWQMIAELQGHRREIWSMAFSPNGDYLITGGSTDETARLWRTETRPPSPENLSLPMDLASAAPSVDGSSIMLTRTNALWSLYDVASEKKSDEQPLHETVCSNFQWIALGPKASKAAIADHKGAIWLMDLKQNTTPVPVSGNGSNVLTMSFSANGELIIALRNVRSVEVWNLKGQLIFEHKTWTYPPPYPQIRAYSLSRDGRTMALGFDNGQAAVFDVYGGKELIRFHEHRWTVTDVAISPDASLAASCSAEGSVKVYNLRTKAVHGILSGQLSDFDALAFSPTGDRLAGGGIGGNVAIWDVTTEQPMELARIRNARHNTRSIQFSDDGNSLIAIGTGLRPVEEVFVWKASPWADVRFQRKTTGVN